MPICHATGVERNLSDASGHESARKAGNAVDPGLPHQRLLEVAAKAQSQVSTV